MIKKLLLIPILALGILLGYISSKPDQFEISREAVFAAGPESLFPQLNNLRKFQDWSPWARIDPECQHTFEGPEAGVGSIHRWSGNDEVGEGSMTILESETNARILSRLDFKKPFEAINMTEFRLVPEEGGKTRLIWTLNGTNSFIGKLFHHLCGIEAMVGGQFEQGLGQLKQLVEK